MNPASALLGLLELPTKPVPFIGVGQQIARERRIQKARVNSAFYANARVAPASRQVLRRKARKLSKRQASQDRLTAIQCRRTKAKKTFKRAA